MIQAGLLVSLTLAAMQPAGGGADVRDDLTRYREIVNALQWSDCCGPFRYGLPGHVGRRVDVIQAALAGRYGRDAVNTEREAAIDDFNTEFGVYDPVPNAPAEDERRWARHESLRWYDGELDALELRLGTAR
jgi:hypothetical protein